MGASEEGVYASKLAGQVLHEKAEREAERRCAMELWQAALALEEEEP